ncbi:hypothetical protein ATN79_06255 [Paraburkholderia caribensis]|nr:hypothetical protein ATN79_06255 [Paraburkholderia caribensis]
MHRLAALILLYVPMAAYARGGYCHFRGCASTRAHLYLFAAFVVACFVAVKTVAWLLRTIEQQRRNPGWLADFLVACKRLFTNL